MNILVLETTGKYGSAAVLKSNSDNISNQDFFSDAINIFNVSSSNEMNHLQDIISITDAVLKEAGITKSDLTHIACSVGPGSFTGIRIGVTTARTLAQSLGLPCIAVSSLRALAQRASRAAIENSCTLILSCLNARRNQTYAGLWRLDGGALTELAPEKQYMIEDILEIAKQSGQKVFITGDGIDAYQDIIESTLDSGSFVLADETLRYQSADSVAEVACDLAAVGNTLTYDKLLPNYMRLAEAEQKLQAGTLSNKISKL